MTDRKRGLPSRHVGVALCTLAICAAAQAAAAASNIPNYTLVGSFDAPQGVFDVLPDGRLISLGGANSDTLFVQDAVNASSYSPIGTFTTELPISTFGASFLTAAPDGQTVAIGDGNFTPDASVYTVALADLGAAPAPTARTISPNFAASFAADGSLYITGADPVTFASGVYRAAPGDGASTRVIGGSGGASAGIAIDNGVLYTGNGFDFAPGGSVTGEVRAVSLSQLDALAPGATVDFENDMTPVAQALSASPIAFDPFGNMLLGGGDNATGDLGYAGVIDAARIAAALTGSGFTPGADLELSPDQASAALYSVRFNTATNELLVFANGTAYRYAVPTPGAAGLFALAGLATRRRRRA